MNSSEIISSGLLESYVLGTANADEIARIQLLCKTHPELVREIEAIEEGLMGFSAGLARPLNPELKQIIAAQLNFEDVSTPAAGTKIIPIHASYERLRVYKFGVAASLLLFFTSFVYNILLQKELQKVSGELTQLSAAKSYMAETLKIQQASLAEMNTHLQVVSHPKVKTVALNGMNALDKKFAMVHWNTQTDEVYFNAASLPPSPAGKQYQLWAIIDGKPVDAGMIDAGSSASVFQRMKPVKGAGAFAVTIETAGGSPVPTMETMCFLGNV